LTIACPPRAGLPAAGRDVGASLPASGGLQLALSSGQLKLALSNQNAFVVFASNYNLGQNPANDQQQFVGIVPIPSK
jgi:hypothetical protein